MLKSRFALAALLTVASLGSIALAPLDGPPINALRRYEPKKYEINFTVSIQQTAATADPGVRGQFEFDEAPIVMPVIYMGQYSKVFVGSEGEGIIVDTNRVPDKMLGKRTDKDKPFNTHHLVMVVPRATCISVKWWINYTMQSWNADIDNNVANATAWPRDMKWPDEVKDGLLPQWGIESDNQVFRDQIQSLFQGTLQTMSPHIAAKRIVAAVLNNFQKTGDGVNRNTIGLVGLSMRGGALTCVSSTDARGRWYGTEHDLVCVCVAFLRAANIPARPVIGIWEDPENDRTTFVSWAEYYLPGSGWVPFDPNIMQGKGGGQYRDVTAKWDYFGKIDELNERVPMAYHFIPPAGVETPRNPALWGWDPRPQKQYYYDQMISMNITSRGKGEEDPR